MVKTKTPTSNKGDILYNILTIIIILTLLSAFSYTFYSFKKQVNNQREVYTSLEKLNCVSLKLGEFNRLLDNYVLCDENDSQCRLYFERRMNNTLLIKC